MKRPPATVGEWGAAARVGREGLAARVDVIMERCRGEGPANCVARCPLHVDVRGYVQLAGEGRWREALQRVRERLPFPGILGHICSHPCELHCKRIDQDSAVKVRDIRRFLAAWEPGKPEHLLDCAPSRGRAVAIVGAGPAGLLAAHDLRRRGYAVTLFERESRLGGCLASKIPRWRLPRVVLDRDLSIIDALGIEVCMGVEVGQDVSLSELRASFGAVLTLVGFGGSRAPWWSEEGLGRGFRDGLRADPLTCETGLEGVFAGGEAVSGPGAAVDAMALGRRAAESAGRFLEGRDLRQGREPLIPPRLLWTLEITEEERRARQRPPAMMGAEAPGMSAAEAQEEAARCLDCSCALCVEQCEFLAVHTSSPRALARRVAGDLAGNLRTVYSCTLCSQCARVCPEGLDTGELMLEARRAAIRRRLGPLPAHRRILTEWRASIGDGPSVLVLSEPGRRSSRRLFFPGCSLPAAAPRMTLRLYDELRRALPGTGVMLHCCGSVAHDLGLDDEFSRTLTELRSRIEDAGAEELITACPDCHRTLCTRLPGVEVRMAWEVLAEEAPVVRSRLGRQVTVLDPCRVRREPAIGAAVRRLVTATGARLVEAEGPAAEAECCGRGGRVNSVDTALAGRIADRLLRGVTHPAVTYCAGCRAVLSGRGVPVTHLVDFLFLPRWLWPIRRVARWGVVRKVNRLRLRRALLGLSPLGEE